MRRLGAWGACALLLLAGCAGDATRRGEQAGARVVRAPDASYRATVALPFAVRALDAHTDQLTLELADSRPITCSIWQEEIELATRVVRTPAALFEALRDDDAGPVSVERISALQGGAAGGVPYHAAHWSYRRGDGVGVMKVAAANKQGRGIACHHDGVGNAPGFEQTFIDLVASFEVEAPPPAPDYAEVQVLRMRGLPVGVEWLRLTRDADGDVRVELSTSLLVPRSADELLASCSTQIEWSTPAGELINAYATQTDLDTRHTQLALRRNAARGWFVQGRFRGKPLDVDLAHEGAIDNGLSEWTALRERLAPQGDEERVQGVRWLADADPTRVIAYELAVSLDDPSRVQARVGPMRMEGLRDEAGLIESGTVAAGNLEMQIERVHQAGTLAGPAACTSCVSSGVSSGGRRPKSLGYPTGR